MAQFDLYRLKGGQLVVDLQTDLIGIDASRIVAPTVRAWNSRRNGSTMTHAPAATQAKHQNASNPVNGVSGSE